MGVEWDDERGVIDAETGRQLLQLVPTYATKKFRREAGMMLVKAINEKAEE